MFQILDFTESKLATLTPRSEKHGDDDVPAVSLGIEMTVPNTLLDSIDKTLRPTLYAAKPDETPELPGVEPSTPILRCSSIDRVKLTSKCEGWTLHVDDGADETLAAAFGGCKVDAMSVEPMNGGSVILRFRVGTSDLDAERSGMLGMHVGQPIWIKLTAPEKAPDAIDGTGEEFARDHPDAGDMFAAAHGGAKGPEDSDPDTEGGETDAGAGETNGAQSETLPADLGTKRRGKGNGAAAAH